MFIDIVILPPYELRGVIQKSAPKIKKLSGVSFVVDNRKLLPHLSLFHLNILPSKLPLVIKALKQVLENQNLVKVTGLKKNTTTQFFDYTVKNSKPLQNLHERVVLGLKEFRKGPMWAKFYIAPDRSSFMKNYGAPGVMENFRPHITLGGIRGKVNIEELILNIAEPKPGSFLGTQVAVTKVNGYWQVLKILQTIKLK